jgi:hypothetical protein
VARFDDVATMLGPKKDPDASTCWCLANRVISKADWERFGPTRREYVRRLCARAVAPGVLAYDDGEVAGWAAVAPREELTFARSKKFPHVDDLPVWSVWCILVRPSHGDGCGHPVAELLRRIGYRDRFAGQHATCGPCDRCGVEYVVDRDAVVADRQACEVDVRGRQ